MEREIEQYKAGRNAAFVALGLDALVIDLQETALNTTEDTQDTAAQGKSRAGRVRLPLNNAVDCRRQVAKVYRQLWAGQMDPNVATKHAYVLMAAVKIIDSSETATRLEALEDSLRTARGRT